MIGGLFKSASRVAIVAAAGIIAGSVSAQAADLGGNCCADLEERVAELEATTARKGNRKVSLTVYGQVNEQIMFWDDDVERNAYVVTNEHSRSRFGFRGEAQITPDWSAGYRIEVGVRIANSAAVNQFVDDNTSTSASLDVRYSEFYVNSKTAPPKCFVKPRASSRSSRDDAASWRWSLTVRPPLWHFDFQVPQSRCGPNKRHGDFRPTALAAERRSRRSAGRGGIVAGTGSRAASRAYLEPCLVSLPVGRRRCRGGECWPAIRRNTDDRGT